MVYGFAKQSGGTLRLQSQVGEGTRAELWLPRASEGDNVAASRWLQNEEPLAHRALHVLLIDDHAEVRGTTAAMLRELGHSIVEAGSGAEALEWLSTDEQDFDLLITDYAMPRQSGTDVVRMGREKHPAMPAVIITGYADGEIGGRPADVGLLMKPFTLSDLSGAVHKALSREAVAP
jgi:CheY-like chemotaxis protein